MEENGGEKRQKKKIDVYEFCFGWRRWSEMHLRDVYLFWVNITVAMFWKHKLWATASAQM